VTSAPGFLSFELLRPVAGENRYFVYSRWETEEDFQAWRNGPAMEAHAEGRQKPISTGASLLEFEVALSAEPAEASTSTASGGP
jgi:heme-degrading monooxygenase HmoA